jgi:hypothetical protein
MQKALKEQAQVLAGERRPHQGDITDVDKKIFEEEGLNYDQVIKKEVKINRLQTKLKTLQTLNQIFDFKLENRVIELQKTIQSLQEN